MSELRDRLAVSTLVQEADSPPEDPGKLTEALDQTADELEQLIAKVNQNQAQRRLPESNRWRTCFDL